MSVPRSRVRRSRDPSPNLLANPDSILPGGAVGEEAAELLHEFIHPHHHDVDQTLVEQDEDEATDVEEADEIALQFEEVQRSQRPWWRRPSAWWFLSGIVFSMAAFSATLAPRIEIFTTLVCKIQNSHPDTPWDEEGLPLISQSFKPIPCAKDPRVQATVATIMALMSTTSGVLSCLTTGVWGSLSDRHGRTKILGINFAGLLVSDITFVLVYLFPKQIPGGFWALLWGPIAEGFVGGRVTSSAAIHAYLADCTDSTSRSRVFSLFLGLLFIGMAIGPTAGSLVTHWTEQAITVFYIATAVHLLFALLTWLVIPESLLPTQMRAFRRRHQEEQASQRASRGLLSRLKSLFSFLSPLHIFTPPKVIRGPTSFTPKLEKRDWSLTLLAAAFGPETLILGSFSYVFQYAAARYDWSSEMLGYFISIVGVTRAAFLAILLPLILKFFRPKTSPIQLPVSSSSEPLITERRSPSPARPPVSESHPNSHVPALDLAIARISLMILVIAYGAMAIAPNTWSFIGLSTLAGFSSGFTPTIQSLALELYRHQGGTESGKLFGGLSVLSALGSQIVGPSLFGLIYIKTVATIPQLIFIVVAGAVFLSFVFLMFVRLPDGLASGRKMLDTEGQDQSLSEGHGGRDETLVDGLPTIVVDEVGDEPVRGRRVSKSVSVEDNINADR